MGSAAGASLGGDDVSGAPPAGGITPSGGDFSSDLGSALSSAYDSAVEEAPPAEPSTETVSEPISEPAPESSTEPAPETETPASAPVTPEIAPVGDAPQYQMTPDGKAYQIPKAEFATIQHAQKYHQAVSQLYPTAQEAQSSFDHASTYRQMMNDWMSGSGAICRACHELPGR